MELDGVGARAKDGGSVHVAIDVGFQNADLHFVFELFDRPLQEGGFARAWAGHDVDEKGFVFLHFRAKLVGVAVVLGKDVLLDFDDADGIHGMLLNCASYPNTS